MKLNSAKGLGWIIVTSCHVTRFSNTGCICVMSWEIHIAEVPRHNSSKGQWNIVVQWFIQDSIWWYSDWSCNDHAEDKKSRKFRPMNDMEWILVNTFSVFSPLNFQDIPKAQRFPWFSCLFQEGFWDSLRQVRKAKCRWLILLVVQKSRG